jgi:hypothetical protein
MAINSNQSPNAFASDDDFFASLSKPASPVTPQAIQSDEDFFNSLSVPKQSTSQGGFTSSLKSVGGALLAGAGQAAKDVGITSLGDAAVQQGRAIQDANRPAVQSFSDIAERPGKWISESAGQMGGQAGLAIAGGLAGRAAGAGLGALTGPFAPVAIPALSTAGAYIGGNLPMLAQEYGSARQEQEQLGVDDKGRALTGALATTAIENLGGLKPGGMANLVTDGVNTLAGKSIKEGAKIVGKKMLRSGVEEGLEEIPQEFTGAYAGGQDDLLTAENMQQGLFGAVSAFPGGALFGAGKALGPLARATQQAPVTPQEAVSEAQNANPNGDAEEIIRKAREAYNAADVNLEGAATDGSPTQVRTGAPTGGADDAGDNPAAPAASQIINQPQGTNAKVQTNPGTDESVSNGRDIAREDTQGNDVIADNVPISQTRPSLADNLTQPPQEETRNERQDANAETGQEAEQERPLLDFTPTHRLNDGYDTPVRMEDDGSYTDRDGISYTADNEAVALQPQEVEAYRDQARANTRAAEGRIGAGMASDDTGLRTQDGRNAKEISRASGYAKETSKGQDTGNLNGIGEAYREQEKTQAQNQAIEDGAEVPAGGIERRPDTATDGRVGNVSSGLPGGDQGPVTGDVSRSRSGVSELGDKDVQDSALAKAKNKQVKVPKDRTPDASQAQLGQDKLSAQDMAQQKSDAKVPVQIKPLVDNVVKNRLTKDEFITQFNEGLNSQNMSKRETAQMSDAYIRKTLKTTPEDFYDKYVATQNPIPATTAQPPAQNPNTPAPGAIANPTGTQAEPMGAAVQGKDIPVLTEEEYLAQQGYGRGAIGEAGLHRSSNNISRKVWQKKVDAQFDKDAEVVKKRAELRQEYQDKVAAGEIRAPSRFEELIKKANGHPDNEAVQAARRLLEKKGIDWENPQSAPISKQEALKNKISQKRLDHGELNIPGRTNNINVELDKYKKQQQAEERKRGKELSAKQRESDAEIKRILEDKEFIKKKAKALNKPISDVRLAIKGMGANARDRFIAGYKKEKSQEPNVETSPSKTPSPQEESRAQPEQSLKRKLIEQRFTADELADLRQKAGEVRDINLYASGRYGADKVKGVDLREYFAQPAQETTTAKDAATNIIEQAQQLAKKTGKAVERVRGKNISEQSIDFKMLNSRDTNKDGIPEKANEVSMYDGLVVPIDKAIQWISYALENNEINGFYDFQIGRLQFDGSARQKIAKKLGYAKSLTDYWDGVNADKFFQDHPNLKGANKDDLLNPKFIAKTPATPEVKPQAETKEPGVTEAKRDKAKQGAKFSIADDKILAKKSEIEEDGRTFKTGHPVTFKYVHNTESATKLFGKPKKDSRFGRYFEPSGQYVTVVGNHPSEQRKNMEYGELTLNNPLVIENDSLNWKEQLSKSFGGKRGKNLSKALIEAGYDGVVTTDNNHTSEVLNLTNFDEAKAKFSQSQPTPGSTVAELTAQLDAADKKLLQSGKLEVVQKASDVPDSAVSIDANGIEGWYDPSTKRIYIVADNVTPDTLRSVLAHEKLHAALAENQALRDRILGAQSELRDIFAQVEAGKYTGRYKTIYDGAMKRVDRANTPAADRYEEFLAYAVSEHSKDAKSLPERLAKAIANLVAAIKAAIYRYTGVPIGRLAPADLSALAKSAMSVQKNGVFINNEQAEKMNTAKASSRAITDTITVDGKERPTTNSNGQLIHQTEEGIRNFWKWFGDSKVVDSQGRPLVVYHGTDQDFSEFNDGDIYFARDSSYAEELVSTKDKTRIVEAYLSIQNPLVVTLDDMNFGDPEIEKEYQYKARKNGKDGIIFKEEDGFFESYVAVKPNQIKSAIGNQGTFSPQSPDIRYSIADDVRESAEKLTANLVDRLSTDKTFNWWHKTVGTQFHKALVDKHFGKVFNRSMQFEQDMARLANEAADLAPSLLPKLDALSDVGKELQEFAQGAIKGQAGRRMIDARKIGEAVFQTTLQDKPMTEKELIDAGYTESQRTMYHEFFAAVNRSLDDLAKSELFRMARALKIGQAPSNLSLKDTANWYAEQAEDANQGKDFIDKAAQVEKLKKQGYAPLMRFGQYTLDVVTPKADGTEKREFFGLFETEQEAKEMEKAMRAEYPDSNIERGVMSQNDWQMFKGVTPETMEVFAKMMNVEQDEAFQAYLKSAVTNRSAMKRLIHRKKMPGFAKDTQRILASFLTSNARSASKNYHLGDLVDAISTIPKAKGDVIDEAVELYNYVQNPSAKGAAIRGLMFAWYLGGSVSSAAVNLTQSFTTTLPYLHQFGDTKQVSRLMGQAMKLAANHRAIQGDLANALKLADEEGITDPKELHMLYGESMRTGMLKNQFLRPLSKAWGSFFSLAETYNRRVAFIAAYNLAKETNQQGPFQFAANAVNETQFVYNKSSRPNWARSTIGSTVFTFKTFTINYLEFLKRLPAKERVIALGVLVAFAGLSGAPGADDLDDLIDTFGQAMGYNTNSKAWKDRVLSDFIGKEAAQYALYGLSHGLPIDVSSRLSVGNIIPGSSLFKKSEIDKSRDVMEFAGPAGSLSKRIVDAFEAAGSRDSFTGQASAVGRAVIPKAMSDLAQAIDMQITGQYRDTRGRKVAEADLPDVLAKALGFQPTSVAEPRRAERYLNQSVTMAKTVEADIAGLWASGIVEQNRDKVGEAKAMLKDWNDKNPETPIKVDLKQIQRRVKQMRMTSGERLLKSTPKEIRRYAREALND